MYRKQDIWDVLQKVEDGKYTLTHLDQVILGNDNVDAYEFIKAVRDRKFKVKHSAHAYNYIRVSPIVNICVARVEGEAEFIVWEYHYCPDRLIIMNDGKIVYERGEPNDDFQEYLEDEDE